MSMASGYVWRVWWICSQVVRLEEQGGLGADGGQARKQGREARGRSVRGREVEFLCTRHLHSERTCSEHELVGELNSAISRDGRVLERDLERWEGIANFVGRARTYPGPDSRRSSTCDFLSYCKRSGDLPLQLCIASLRSSLQKLGQSALCELGARAPQPRSMYQTTALRKEGFECS